MIKELYEKYKNLINQFKLERLIWIKAGKPLRSKDSMLEIYTICKSCEYFDSNSCTICGCRLHPSDTVFPNKILWATTECPKNKWGSDVEIDGIEINKEDIIGASSNLPQANKEQNRKQNKENIKNCNCK